MKVTDFKEMTLGHVEYCKKLEKNIGICEELDCLCCPFSRENATNEEVAVQIIMLEKNLKHKKTKNS